MLSKEVARKYVDTTVVPNRYWDKNGKEIKDGSIIMLDGREREVVLLDDEERLGIDATNPRWIETGKAEPFQYGCYQLLVEDCMNAEVISN